MWTYAAPAKTTKLFILDVKPRSAAVGAGPQLLSAYGVDNVELTLPEEPGMNMLRSKFGTRPGLLTNSNVAQPEAIADLVIGRDNPNHMPVEVLRSKNDGTDLYVMRNNLFVGEMMYRETSGTAQKKKKGAAGGTRTTSRPKPKQLKAKDPPTASNRPEKAAPVQTPAAASKRPEAGQFAGPVCGGLRLHDVLGERSCERHASERWRPEKEQFKRTAPDLRQEEQCRRGEPHQRGPRGQPRRSGAGQWRQQVPRGQPGDYGARQQRQHI